MSPDAFAAQAWLLSVSVSALALVRGVLWMRGSPSGGNGRDSARTLALVERQQVDSASERGLLERAIGVLAEQQGLLREVHALHQGQQAVLVRLSDQMERVADSLDRTVGNLTAITADVEHTQMDVAAHRVVSGQAVAQVAEIHAHLMRRRKR